MKTYKYKTKKFHFFIRIKYKNLSKFVPKTGKNKNKTSFVFD